MIKLLTIIGARPQIIKAAALSRAVKSDFKDRVKEKILHTGQHYDAAMSQVFFDELGIPQPDNNLGIGSGRHGEQTAKMISGIEEVILSEPFDGVVIYGDTNSTLAGAVAAVKQHIPVFHIEAGLRSFNMAMPEEINRLVTDAISDVFITTSTDADENLVQEGVSTEKIFMLGNLMIDSLVANREKASKTELRFKRLGSERQIALNVDFMRGNYGIVTFHRPGNVDDKALLSTLIEIWGRVSEQIPLVFPIHPRTWKNIQTFGLHETVNKYEHLFLIEPLSYLQFMNLVKHAKFALTDSGGIQEETTFLNVPCLTVRPNTERPITIWEGSNKLIKIEDIITEVNLILSGKGKQGTIPKYWDGETAGRIVKLLETL